MSSRFKIRHDELKSDIRPCARENRSLGVDRESAELRIGPGS
jgi:hypothetical protein